MRPRRPRPRPPRPAAGRIPTADEDHPHSAGAAAAAARSAVPGRRGRGAVAGLRDHPGARAHRRGHHRRGRTAGRRDGRLRRHRQLFLGTDPLDIVAQVRTIEAMAAAALVLAAEAACWDIIGQVTGQPVSMLFGNAAKRLPAYASTNSLRSPADRAESASAIRERGFRAMKIRIDRTRLREGVESVRRAREAVGDDFEIMVDLDQSSRVAGGRRTPDLVRTRKLVAELAESASTGSRIRCPIPISAGLQEPARRHPHVRIAAGGLIARSGTAALAGTGRPDSTRWTSCTPSACCAPDPRRTRAAQAPLYTPRTGPTASPCSRTCTWRPASAAALLRVPLRPAAVDAASARFHAGRAGGY